jgi:hypothetical protein
MIKPRFLDKTYLGENPKAPQNLNTLFIESTILNSLTQQLQI